MKSENDIQQIVNNYYELGQTIEAANFIIREYGLEHPNFKGFELREKATADFILMTTEGDFEKPQIIRIPENTFEFSLNLMLNLFAHEMIHVGQKSGENRILDKNEREWQAYYEMLFHLKFPQIPELPDFQKKFFANKAIDYYHKMGTDSDLQLKYKSQKLSIDLLLKSLK